MKTLKMRTLKITHKISGRVLYQGEAESIAGLLKKASKKGVDLSEADLAGVDLSGHSFSKLKLSRARLNEALLNNTVFNNCEFHCVTFDSAELDNAAFARCNLRGCDFDKVNLNYTHFSWCDLKNSIFSEARIIYTDFYGSDLRDVNLKNAVIVKPPYLGGAVLGHTVWPDNYPVYSFDLGKHPAIATRNELIIGCRKHTWNRWLERWDEIGLAHGYTPKETDMYGVMIHAMYELVNNARFEKLMGRRYRRKVVK